MGRAVLTAAGFLSLACFGFSVSILGAALPVIRDDLHLSIVAAGSYIAISNLVFTLLVVGGGAAADVIGRTRVLLIGCTLAGTMLLLFGAWPVFVLNLVIMALLGCGNGLIEAGSNPLLVDLYPRRAGVILTIHHFFFSVGALLGPVIMGQALARGGGWRSVYAGVGALSLALVPAFAGARRAARWHRRDDAGPRWGALIGHRTLLLLAAVTLLYQGAQMGILSWAVSYLTDARGVSVVFATTMLTVFLVAVAAGRLLVPFFLRRWSSSHLLVGGLTVMTLTFAAMMSVRGPLALPVAFGLLGLAAAGVYPSLLALAGIAFRGAAGTALGILAGAGGTGATLVPFLMAGIAQRFGLTAGMLTFGTALACGLAVSLASYGCLQRVETEAPSVP